MASNFQKIGALATGGIVYIGSCYYAYNSMKANQQDVHDTQHRLRDVASFVDNPKRNEQYQHVAEFYDAQIGRDELAMGINLLRRSLLYFHAKGTVLEVGAGTGRNLSYYPKSTVDRVVLIDSSDQMLLQARKKVAETAAQAKPKFACLQADSSELSFPNDSFDTVVDTFGLCSYDDPVQVLNEMERVCKPGGKVLLLEHGRSKTWDFITQYLDKHAERHAKNWGCVWNRDLDRLLEKSNLVVDKVDTWHFGTTYYVIARA